MNEAASLYLDLTKKALTFLLYGQELYAPAEIPKGRIKRLVFDGMVKRGMMSPDAAPAGGACRSVGACQRAGVLAPRHPPRLC